MKFKVGDKVKLKDDVMTIIKIDDTEWLCKIRDTTKWISFENICFLESVEEYTRWELVEVRNESDKAREERIYLFEKNWFYHCVTSWDEDYYDSNTWGYDVSTWNYIRKIPKKEKVSIELTKEQLEKVKEILNTK